jgi:hypothetical protein
MTSGSFSGVYLVSGNLETVSSNDVASVEKQLDISFPPGYAEYVTTLGLGTYSGYVRVYMPSRIRDELSEFRERWNEYYFWDIGREVLEKQRVLESVIIADSIDGDEIIFHPSRPDMLYVLPRHDDMIYHIGSSLGEALHWMCKGSVLADSGDFDYFYPWKDRADLKFSRPGSDLPFTDLKDQFLTLGLHSHVIVDAGERSFQLFVNEFGGDVHGYLYRAESMSNHIPLWSVHLNFDAANTASLVLQKITGLLHTLNFTPSAF